MTVTAFPCQAGQRLDSGSLAAAPLYRATAVFALPDHPPWRDIRFRIGFAIAYFRERQAITNSRVFHRNFRAMEATNFPPIRYPIERPRKSFHIGLNIQGT
jgi:hypothetical protein